MIPQFETDFLEDQELQAFLKHYSTCEACREELSIRYLVQKGLPNLESGKTFHLQQEVDRGIREAEIRLQRRSRLEHAAYTMEIGAIGLMLLCGIFLLLI